MRGVIPALEAVNMSSVRAGSEPPGTVDEVGGGFTGGVAVDGVEGAGFAGTSCGVVWPAVGAR